MRADLNKTRQKQNNKNTTNIQRGMKTQENKTEILKTGPRLK